MSGQYVCDNIYIYGMGGGLELGFVSVDIIVSCQRCSYSSGGVVTNTCIPIFSNYTDVLTTLSV